MVNILHEKHAERLLDGALSNMHSAFTGFEAAVELLEFCQARARAVFESEHSLDMESDALNENPCHRLAANAAQLARLKEHQRFCKWQFIAARDGAMSMYHFFMAMRGLREPLQNSEELRNSTGADLRIIDMALREFLDTFPDYAGCRNAVAHKSEIQKKTDHWLNGWFMEHILGDQTFSTTTFGGAVVSYELNRRTLKKLHRIYAKALSAFSSQRIHTIYG